MISKVVKAKVFQRDNGRCIICGKPAAPEAHVVPRSQGGLGVEENIVTLCRDCHRRYDQSAEREAFGKAIREYLVSIYPGWNEENLIYRKEEEYV